MSQFGLRPLVRNTALNFASFGIVSVLSLVTIAWLISAYGMRDYGFIVLARYLLPAGVLAALDFGLSEAATRLVARAQASQASSELSETITVSLVVAGLVGVVVGTGVALGSGWIALDFFLLAGEQGREFQSVVLWSGVAITVLLPGQVAEGVLKGFNAFPLIRAADVAAAVGYTAAVFSLIHFQSPYYSVAYAYLAISGCRSFGLLAGIALFASRNGRWTPQRFDRLAIARVAGTAWPMFFGKSIAVAFMYLPPLAIGRLAGPAAVGVFDVLMRIPRLAKVIIGVAVSAVLPAAAAFDARGQGAKLAQMSRTGSVLIMYLSIPPIVATALYAQQIMALWLGPEFSYLGAWLTLFLGWAAALSAYQMTSTVVAARLSALRRFNWLNTLQLLLTLGLAFALFAWLQERAFVVAIVGVELAALPLRLQIAARELGEPPALYWSGPLRIVSATLALAAGFLALDVYFGPLSAAMVAVSFVVFCGLSWWILHRFAFTPDERADLKRVVAAGLNGRVSAY